MNSLKKWLNNTLWPILAKRFFRLQEIEAFIKATDERYLDAEMWAKIRGISVEEAKSRLDLGIKMNYLQECLLYEWPDSPVPFITPKSYLGKHIKLSEIGYSGDDDQREVYISPHRTRVVYVASDSKT
jgi:hypothetical protein